MAGIPTSRPTNPHPPPHATARAVGPARGPDVDLADPGRYLGAGELTWLRDHAARAAALLAAGGEVRVRVVADPDMTRAHERFHGVSSTTDVLTFDLSGAAPAHPVEPGEPSTRALDADILVCFDEAARQARARGHAPEHELLLYIIHGLLHCLGHDDTGEAAAARMHRAEDRTLEALGIGAVYARPARAVQPGPGAQQ